MPIYAYRCSSCGFEKDVLQKLSDASLTRCPSCGQEAFGRTLTAPAFQLKGTGWYVTDFRENGAKKEGKDAKDSGAEGGAADSSASPASGGEAPASGGADKPAAAPAPAASGSSTPAPAPAPAAKGATGTA